MITTEFFSAPKSHVEWVDNFNKTGNINRIIIANDTLEKYNKKLGQKHYRIEELYKNVKHFDSFVRELFISLEIEPLSVLSSGTRYEHDDDSDYTGWILWRK